MAELPYELDAVLSPIEGEDPTGVEPDEDSFSSPLVVVDGEYTDALKDEKRASEAERDGDNETSGGEFISSSYDHWTQVCKVGIELLSNEWKDFDVLAKVVQGLTRLYGIDGICFGYQVAQGFVDQYWDAFMSRWQNQAVGRLDLLNNLNQALPTTIRRMPITDASGEDQLLYWQYSLAIKVDGMDAEERQKRAPGAVGRMDFLDQVKRTPDAFYVELVASIEACKQSLDQFAETLRLKLSEADQIAAMPATTAIIEALDDVEKLVRELAGDRLAPPEADEPDEELEAEAAENGESAPRRPAGSDPVEPRSRDSAFRQMELVARYFEKAEPQSLLPAAIREVVRLGQLAPEDLFTYLIDDSTARNQMFRLVGMKEPSSEGEEEY